MPSSGEYDYSGPGYRRRCAARKAYEVKLRSKGIVENSSKWDKLMGRARRRGYR